MHSVLVVDEGNAPGPGRLTDLLRAAGFAVSTLSCPDLARAEAHRADAIVLDLAAAPGSAWADVCSALRRDRRTARLPILLVGHYPLDAPAGLVTADYHLPVPYSAGTLTTRLRHLIVANALVDAALAGIGSGGRAWRASLR
jgi:DNA-binding response OmpR family regulator